MSGLPSEPLRALQRLARDEATGELVCAGPAVEVHVHFQEGRVAWATSSAARFAFGRYVVEAYDIDEGALRELVQECRRERKPLGETLIEWGVATAEQVRSALQRQIEDAIETLREERAAQTVFLQRGASYQSYNRDFTFALAEVCKTGRRRRVSEQRLPVGSSRPGPMGISERLRELTEQEPDIRWVEHHRSGGVTERLPEATRPLGIHALARPLLDDGVDFVAVRGGVENLIGIGLPDGAGSVWCGVDPAVVLGAMVTILRDRLAMQAIGRPSSPGSAPGPARVSEDRGVLPHVLEEILDRAPAVWGVALVDGAEHPHELARREGVDVRELVERISPMSAFLRAARRLAFEEGSGVALPRASMVAASRACWIYGAELLDDTSRDLWILVDPSAGQGLGWAILEVLLRRTSITSRELSR